MEGLAKEKKKNVISYGKNKDSDFWASRINNSVDGMHFVLNNKDSKCTVEASVLGKYQIYVLIPLKYKIET